MGADEHLFHIMTEKMGELVLDKSLTPDKHDLSVLLDVLRVGVCKMRQTHETFVANAALRLASGELCGKLDYYISEQDECFDGLLDAMVICGVLDELRGDNHTAYVRER